MKQHTAVIMAAVFGLALAFLPLWTAKQANAAGSSEWTMDTTETGGHGGMYFNNYYHNSNLLIKELNVDTVHVYYPDVDEYIYDPLLLSYETDGDTDTNVPGTTTVWREFYIGDPGCSAEFFPTQGCYKYRLQQVGIDSTATTSAKFKPQLKVYGVGYSPCQAAWYDCSNGSHQNWGYPVYTAFVRLDLDAPGSGADYLREKNPAGCSGWNDLNVEDIYADNGCTGQQYRIQDSQTGWSSSFGIDPATSSSFDVWDLRANFAEWNSTRVSSYANNESVYLQDIIAWVQTSKLATSSQCYYQHVCTLETVLIPNGGW